MRFKRTIALAVSLIFIILSLFALFGCNKSLTMLDTAYAEDGLLDVAVLADLHYVSPTLIENTSVECFRGKKTDAKTLAVSASIVKEAIDKVVQSGVKFAFVAGDLCDNHALVSHTELAAIFADAESRGVQIYVAPGNHDVAPTEGYEGYRYTSDGLVRVPDFYQPTLGQDATQTIAQQFKTIYNQFGYSQAVAQNGLNYAVDVGEKYRLIVVDNCSAELSEQNAIWAKQQVEQAISQDKTPIAMMHKPIDNIFGDVAPIVNLFSDTFSNSVTARANFLKNTLSAAGLKFVLTGHNHANSVAKLKGADGTSTLFDIMTQSLSQVGNSYRRLRFSQNYVVSTMEKLNGIKAEYLPAYLTVDERAEIADLDAFSKKQLNVFLEEKISGVGSLTEQISELFYGEEQPDPQFENLIGDLTDFLAAPFVSASDDSVSALYQKYGASLPQGAAEFSSITDLVARTMEYILTGERDEQKSRLIADMLGASVKGVIVFLIDKGLFSMSDRFLTPAQSVLDETCQRLLRYGEFELLNSGIVHNLLQLPFVDELKSKLSILENLIPAHIYNEDDFSKAVDAVEIAGALWNMEFAKYFEIQGTGESGNTLYSGLFYSDLCLREQVFENIAAGMLSGEIPARSFVMNLNSYEYSVI
jgi:3',5'-cyclic AMP phosphodiesterase CpdA